MFVYKAKEKGIKMSFEIAKDLPEMFISDSDRLKQILANLLSNSIKFNQKGGKIKIHANFNGQDNSIEFSVEDTGIGIAEEDQEKIFERFYEQSEDNTTPGKENNRIGLGLTVSKCIAKSLGGLIKVKSELDVGSTFTLVIPLLGF